MTINQLLVTLFGLQRATSDVLRANYSITGVSSWQPRIPQSVTFCSHHTSKLRENKKAFLMTWNSRIRWLSLGVLLLVIVHITLLTGHLDPPRLFQSPPHDSPEPTQNCLAHESLKQLSGEWDSSRVLKGPPTAKFRGNAHFFCRSRPLTMVPDNLLNNLSYITSGANAGLS